jgi:lipopolysaccharide/colanic/teichoic acid biosynthesis glycosyltransferase
MDKFIEKIVVFGVLLVFLPFLIILYLIVRLDSPGPFLFKQKRAGKNKKPFTMFKIRTMVENAEELKAKYSKLNEANEPVFKIKNDPRHTRVGRLLSRLALDEIPQFLNVIRGEMAIVGPRPLPLDEAARVPKRYEKRFSLLPGMTSPWVVKGLQKLSFEDWMKLDLEYIKKKSLWYDTKILFQTFLLILKVLISPKNEKIQDK